MTSLNERFRALRERIAKLKRQSSSSSNSSSSGDSNDSSENEESSGNEEPALKKGYNDTLAIARLKNTRQSEDVSKVEPPCEKTETSLVSESAAQITLSSIHHARYANFLSNHSKMTQNWANSSVTSNFGKLDLQSSPKSHISGNLARNACSLSTLSGSAGGSTVIDEKPCTSSIKQAATLTESASLPIVNRSSSRMSLVTLTGSVSASSLTSATTKHSGRRSISLDNAQHDIRSCAKTPSVQTLGCVGSSSGRTSQNRLAEEALVDSGRGSSVQNTSCNTQSAKNMLIVNKKQYQILTQIARGGSCVVYHVFSEETRQCYAVKCVDLSEADDAVLKSYKNEVLLLEKLQFSNRVVRLIDYEYCKAAQILYVVMEKGDADLATVFKTCHDGKSLPALTVAFYWSEMLKAVQVVHEQGIVHSDLKPKNFLLVGGHLKLIDFGIANAVPPNKTTVTKECQMGTPNYMSPEALLNCGDMADLKYKVGVKSDVWSLGCILYNMVYGVTPFQHIADRYKFVAITSDAYKIEFRPTEDKLVVDVLQRCLERDTKRRASVEELISHPYLSTKINPIVVTEKKWNDLAEAVSRNTPRSNAKLLKKAFAGMEHNQS